MLIDWSPWNSLEVAKFVASLLTPVVIAVAGIKIHKITKKFESRQWLNQKLIEKRLVTYDNVAPILNDLLCYFTRVGDWKRFDPPDVVALKRILDKQIYLALPLFDDSFLAVCLEFEYQCFELNQGYGGDAKLRATSMERRHVHPRSWDPKWDNSFTQEQVDEAKVRSLYWKIMNTFTVSFGESDYLTKVN